MVEASNGKKSWRRRALGLRAMMVAMVVIAVPLAWKANKARAQRRAVEAIRQAAGIVSYDYEHLNFEASGTWRYAGAPPEPAWLLSSLGIDFFHEPREVIIKARASDPPRPWPIRQAFTLPSARDIFLMDVPVTAADLGLLEGRTNLGRSA